MWSTGPEFFRVTFDDDIDRMLGEGRGLIAAWRQLKRHSMMRDPTWRLAGLAMTWLLPAAGWAALADLPELHHFLHLVDRHARLAGRAAAVEARRLLHDDLAWGPFAILRPVFKALVHADYEFACRYCPMGSHEERLTGALMATIVSNLEVVRDAVREKGEQIYGEPVELAFAYDDLAARGQEKHTGADFGILLFVNLPGTEQPHISAAVFQAKKIRREGEARSARIELGQLEAIEQFAGFAAYYCFYEANPRRCLPPVVAEARRIRWEVEDREDQASAAFDVIDNARCSLAEFLIFGMLLFGSEGERVSSLHEGIQFLRLGQGEEPLPEFAPRRRLVIALGSTREQDVADVAELLYHEPRSDDDVS